VNKSASGLFDIYAIFMFFIITAIFAGLALYIVNVFNNQWQDVDTDVVTENSQEATQGYTDNMNMILDGAIVFWILILWVGSLVTSFFLDNSPVWFVIFFILSLLSFFAILPFANIISDLSESGLSSGFQYLPMAMFISNNLIFFMIAYIVSIGGALYVKKRMEQ